MQHGPRLQCGVAELKKTAESDRESNSFGNYRPAMGSQQQHTAKPPSKQPPKVVNPTSSSPFNAGTSHISMAITTSKNQIFIIVCHLPLDSFKRGSLA